MKKINIFDLSDLNKLYWPVEPGQMSEQILSKLTMRIHNPLSSDLWILSTLYAAVERVNGIM